MRFFIIVLFLPIFVFAQNSKKVADSLSASKWQYEVDPFVVFPHIDYANTIKTNSKMVRLCADLTLAERNFLSNFITVSHVYFADTTNLPEFESGVILNFYKNKIFIIPPAEDSIPYFYVIDTFYFHIEIYYVQYGESVEGGSVIFNDIENISLWTMAKKYDAREWLPSKKQKNTLRK